MIGRGDGRNRVRKSHVGRLIDTIDKGDRVADRIVPERFSGHDHGC